jgi:hypothetical protein
MDAYSSIADVVDVIYSRKLSEHVAELRRRIHRSEPPCFIMGYCAANTTTFRSVSAYIRQQVSPQLQRPHIEIALNPELLDLRAKFCEMKYYMQSLKENVVFIEVTGFERLNAIAYETGASMGGRITPCEPRIAHDYDQRVCEDSKKIFSGLRKNVVVVTQINPDPCLTTYKGAVRSALQSQFKAFLLEYT